MRDDSKLNCLTFSSPISLTKMLAFAGEETVGRSHALLAATFLSNAVEPYGWF